MNDQPIPPISLDEQLVELERELEVRERIYPKWVQKGTLKNSTAAYRIAVLKAVIDTLKGKRQPSLL